MEHKGMGWLVIVAAAAGVLLAPACSQSHSHLSETRVRQWASLCGSERSVLAQVRGQAIEFRDLAGLETVIRLPSGRTPLRGTISADGLTVLGSDDVGIFWRTIPDGREIWALEGPVAESTLRVSRDGNSVTFASKGSLYVAVRGESAIQSLGTGSAPSWQQQRVVASDREETVVIDPATNSREYLWRGTSPVASPTDDRILYRDAQGHWMIRSVADRAEYQLPIPSDTVSPEWSPNARCINWVGEVSHGGSFEEARPVMLLNLTTLEQVEVFDVFKGNPAMFQWVSEPPRDR